MDRFEFVRSRSVARRTAIVLGIGVTHLLVKNVLHVYKVGYTCRSWFNQSIL